MLWTSSVIDLDEEVGGRGRERVHFELDQIPSHSVVRASAKKPSDWGKSPREF